MVRYMYVVCTLKFIGQQLDNWQNGITVVIVVSLKLDAAAFRNASLEPGQSLSFYLYAVDTVVLPGEKYDVTATLGGGLLLNQISHPLHVFQFDATRRAVTCHLSVSLPVILPCLDIA